LLTEKVKNLLGQVWTDELKKKITKLAIQFLADNALDNTVEFAVVLERGAVSGINGYTDIFRGIKLIS